MIFFSNISTLLKRLRYDTIDPARDWITLLMLAFIALAGILSWHLWIFQTVIEGGDFSATETSAPPLFDPAELRTIRAIFEARAAEVRKYETGIYSFADPSQ
ncbi:hypothetical protein HYV30_02860 [Candidatus Kaiserbacteria bacterium]|nr:hypothetical protein [Candidatus Kaiserbacteria bacterium]